MTIAAKLLELDAAKADIKAALETQGIDTTSMPFTDYADGILAIEGGGGGEPYTRPSDWIECATWVQGADHRIAIVTRVIDDNSGVNRGNLVQVRCTTNTGTWQVDWGDGTSTTGIASGTNTTHTYTYSDGDLTDTVSTLGYKQALIKISPSSTNQITGFTTQNASQSGNLGYVEISAKVPNCTTFEVFGDTFPSYFLESLIIYSLGATSISGAVTSNVVYGALQNVVITSASMTTTPNIAIRTLKYAEYNLSSTSAITFTSFYTGNDQFSNGVEKIVINLATNSNFSLNSVFIGCDAMKELVITNSGSGVVSDMTNAFVNDGKLEYITIPGATSTCSLNQCFDRCFAVKKLTGFTSITSNSSFTANFRSASQACIDGLSSSIAFSGDGTVPFQQSINIYSIPAWNLSGITSWSDPFQSCVNLARVRATLPSLSIDFSNCNLSSVALNEIYTNLPSASSKTITVSGNPGTTGDTPSIATGKGWTVTG